MEEKKVPLPDYGTATQELSPELQRKYEEIKTDALRKFKIISLLIIGVAVVSFGIGIAIVVVGQTGTLKAKNPLTTGINITCGFMMFFCGGIGYALSMTDPTSKDMEVKRKQYGLLYSFYIMAIVSMSSTSMAIGYTIWGAVACGNEKTDPCGSNYEPEMPLNIVGTICAAILFACIMTVLFMFCKCRRAFYVPLNNKGCCGCC